MVTKIRSRRLNLEIVLAMERARDKLRNEPKLARDELHRRIVAAAEEIGIPDVEVIEVDPDNMGSRFTYGFVRPKRNYSEGPSERTSQDCRTDLGYIELDLHTQRFTRRSFSINGDAFSDERYKQFHRALTKRKLEPRGYIPSCGPIFYTEEELRWERVRNEKAAYR